MVGGNVIWPLIPHGSKFVEALDFVFDDLLDFLLEGWLSDNFRDWYLSASLRSWEVVDVGDEKIVYLTLASGQDVAVCLSDLDEFLVSEEQRFRERVKRFLSRNKPFGLYVASPADSNPANIVVEENVGKDSILGEFVEWVLWHVGVPLELIVYNILKDMLTKKERLPKKMVFPYKIRILSGVLKPERAYLAMARILRVHPFDIADNYNTRGVISVHGVNILYFKDFYSMVDYYWRKLNAWKGVFPKDMEHNVKAWAEPATFVKVKGKRAIFSMRQRLFSVDVDYLNRVESVLGKPPSYIWVQIIPSTSYIDKFIVLNYTGSKYGLSDVGLIALPALRVFE